MKFSKLITSFFSIILSLLMLVILFYIVFLPIANWYYNHYLLGVDFFLTATFVNFLKLNFTLPPGGYLDFWWSGMPLSGILNPLQYYLIVPLTKYFSVIDAVKIYMLITILLSGIFTYFVCFRLSKNHFVAAVLASLVLCSEGLYGSLTWGGSLPYFATQMFLPLVTGLILIHLERNDKKLLILAASILGLSFLAHPLGIIAFIVPLTVLILLFGLRIHPVSLKKKVKDLFIIGIISFFAGLPLTINLLSGFINFFRSGGATLFAITGGSAGAVHTAQTHVQSRFLNLFTEANSLFYILLIVALIIYLISLLLGKERKKGLITILPFLFFTLYIIGQIAANAFGHPIFSQSWYRAYWPFTFALAFLTASLIGAIYKLLAARLKLFSIFSYLFFGIFFIGVLALTGPNNLTQKLFANIENDRQLSSPSSAYPEAWQLAKTEAEREQLKKQILPSFINPQDKNYRLYESDAQVNVWWSYAYPSVPLVRGYTDQPLATTRLGNIFMLDQAIGNEGLVNNFKYDKEIAKNIALYYIDWYAIRYFEGGHLSLSPNAFPSNYLDEAIDKKEETKTTGVVRLYETASGKPEIYKDVDQYLNFYRFKDELVSPVLSSTVTPLVLIVSDDTTYEHFTKILSYENINSQKVIPLRKSEYLDDFSPDELKQFSAIFAYNYKYKNRDRAYKNLEGYVKNGGKLFIDTGFDFQDSDSRGLPELFPFQGSQRGQLSDKWNLEFGSDEITDGLTQKDFGPPVYDKYPWKFTFPAGELKEGVKVLLKNQQKPILTSYQIGSGTVVWSGMNLPYHIVSSEGKKERQLLIATLNKFIPLTVNRPLLGEANFISPKKIEFNTTEGKGVLLRQERYKNWKVTVNGENVDTYMAGPAYPGFIYVPLTNQQGPYKITFTFKGDFRYYWIWFIVLLTYIVVIDYVLLKSVLFGKIGRFIKLNLSKKISHWWEREEE